MWQRFFDLLIRPSLHMNLPSVVHALIPPAPLLHGMFLAYDSGRKDRLNNINSAYFFMHPPLGFSNPSRTDFEIMSQAQHAQRIR